MNNKDLLKLVKGAHPLQDVIEACLLGQTIELRPKTEGFDVWVELKPSNGVLNCEFNPDRYEYRIAPLLLNGVEVPPGLTKAAADSLPEVFIPYLQTWPGGATSLGIIESGFGPRYRAAVNGGFAFETQADARKYGEALFKLALEDGKYV